MPSVRQMAPLGPIPTRPVRISNPRRSWLALIKSNLPLVLTSDQSSQVYGGKSSGLFGLASGRSTNTLNVSVVGGVFNRQPARPSVTYGLALQPPTSGGSDNAGSLHWLGADPNAYTGGITWKLTTATSDSDVSSFDIDGWQFKTGGTTVTNSNQDLASAVDPYYVNMFFPAQEAQLIRE